MEKLQLDICGYEKDYYSFSTNLGQWYVSSTVSSTKSMPYVKYETSGGYRRKYEKRWTGSSWGGTLISSTKLSTGYSSGSSSGYPIALDMDGVELIDLAESDAFMDVGLDGDLENVGWVASDDGILIHDANNYGKVDDFSEVSFLDDLEGVQTDLEGLAGHDSNALSSII